MNVEINEKNKWKVNNTWLNKTESLKYQLRDSSSYHFASSVFIIDLPMKLVIIILCKCILENMFVMLCNINDTKLVVISNNYIQPACGNYYYKWKLFSGNVSSAV